jgi:hypothetical protein
LTLLRQALERKQAMQAMSTKALMALVADLEATFPRTPPSTE